MKEIYQDVLPGVLISPLQLIRYIAGIANNGKLMKPFLKKDTAPQVFADLSEYGNNIKEVQKGMREAVTSPMGTARLLQDLPIPAAGKTGSAQVANNTQENAFFVGYMPYEPTADSPQIALLILVERSKAGSLNAVPIAKDALAWYYEHRMKGVEN